MRASVLTSSLSLVVFYGQQRKLPAGICAPPRRCSRSWAGAAGRAREHNFCTISRPQCTTVTWTVHSLSVFLVSNLLECPSWSQSVHWWVQDCSEREDKEMATEEPFPIASDLGRGHTGAHACMCTNLHSTCARAWTHTHTHTHSARVLSLALSLSLS